MQWIDTVSECSKKALQVVIHLSESVVAWIVLICALLMGFHLTYEVIVMLFSGMVKDTPMVIKPVILEALDILILFEIAQMFIKMEADQKLTVRIMMDTAILFSVRESIIGLYAGKESISWALVATLVFVGLRIAYSFKRRESSHSK
jgi:uncharacterized membrane protein (DUF373 family)